MGGPKGFTCCFLGKPFEVNVPPKPFSFHSTRTYGLTPHVSLARATSSLRTVCTLPQSRAGQVEGHLQCIRKLVHGSGRRNVCIPNSFRLQMHNFSYELGHSFQTVLAEQNERLSNRLKGLELANMRMPVLSALVPYIPHGPSAGLSEKRERVLLSSSSVGRQFSDTEPAGVQHQPFTGKKQLGQ